VKIHNFKRMPCPCNLPLELYPEAAEWGPLLWTILHALAEKSGRTVSPLYGEDERRTWIHFFKHTSEIIPCHVCKEHFRLYLKEHPVDELKTIPLSGLHNWIRTWFWEVHQWVNMTLEKPSFSMDLLTVTYSNIDIRTYIKRLEAPLKRAIMLSGNQYIKFNEWKSKTLLLLSLFGM
jgi:hypothetical protein